MERNEFALAGMFALILSAILIISLAVAGASSSNMAAWAQAIGSVGAIIAAIYVGWQALDYERRRDDVLARAFCLRAMAPLVGILGEAQRAKAFGEQTRYGLNLSTDPVKRLTEGAKEAEDQLLGYIEKRLRILTQLPERPLEQMVAVPAHIVASIEQLDQALKNHQIFLVENLSAILLLNDEGETRYLLAAKSGLDAIIRLAGEVRDYAGGVTDQVVLHARRARSGSDDTKK